MISFGKMKRIVCFGDSNTYGYIPNNGKRYSSDIRWTSRLSRLLGKEFEVTRERIRQIEAKALRKLRHPSRSKKLKDYLD